MEDTPLLTDLIPKRLGTFWLLFLLGVSSVVCILFLYFKLPEINQIAETGNRTTFAAFDVTRRDSLASWLMTFLWGMAAFGAVLVYIICRSEQDFRRLSDIWVWGAIACLYLSLDQVAGLRILFRDVVIHFTGTQLYGDGNLWWVAVYLIVFGMIGTRVLAEIHHYLPACNSLLMAGTCFIVSGCAELELLLPGREQGDPQLGVFNAMLCSGAAMMGGLFLVLSIGLYGRRLIVTDPATCNMWYSSIWRKLSRRVKPTMYSFTGSDSYEKEVWPEYRQADEYHENGSHRPRQCQTVTDARARKEYCQDEDDLTPADQETLRRRKSRIRKAKKGTFY